MRLLHAGLSQNGRELVLSLRTSAPVALGKLEPHPDTGAPLPATSASRSAAAAAPGERRLCLGGPQGAPARRAGAWSTPTGKPVGEGTPCAATVKRPQPEKLVLALVPGDAGLTPQRYRWRVPESSRLQDPAASCAEALPAAAAGAFRLRPVRAVGCTGGSAGLDHQRPARPQGRRPHLRRRAQRIHARLPRRAARKGRRRRPSSRSARRCRAAKRRCARSSPKATRSATTR